MGTNLKHYGWDFTFIKEVKIGDAAAFFYKNNAGKSTANFYKAVSPNPLTRDELCDLQLALGFHPMSYGFYNLAEGVSEYGSYEYTWDSFSFGD